MEPAEAERLHKGLRTAFKDLYAFLDGARFEDRAGYSLLVCPSLLFPQFNGVWAEEPGDLAVAELAGAIAELERLGLPCWVQTRTGSTTAIVAETRRLGLTAEVSIPGMVATAADLQQSRRTGIEITRVGTAACELAQAQAVAEAGFEVPADLFAPMFTPRVAAMPSLAIYLARADDRPVSTAFAWTGGGTVGIFNVATLPEHRGRGYGAAVTVRAVRDGFTSGADLAWLQSSPVGESVYLRIGFRQVETYTLLSRPDAT
jgi:ribosomal protein S18 acetylase RimI-like enzyme